MQLKFDFEEWRVVSAVKWQKHYEVSNYGRVRSVDRRIRRGPTMAWANVKGQMLKPYLMKIGYYRVSFGMIEHQYIHRLVAEAFVPNPLGLREVNHKDLDKTNNHWQNLEWVDHTGNMRHAFKAKGMYHDDNGRFQWAR